MLVSRMVTLSLRQHSVDAVSIDMKLADDPVGPNNDAYLIECIKSSYAIMVGWGARGSHRNRDKEVVDLLIAHAVGKSIMHVGLTQGGQPKHPLYSSTKCELYDYRWTDDYDTRAAIIQAKTDRDQYGFRSTGDGSA